MSWTEHKVQELTRLWEAGHSAAAIGRIIGMSKNAVIGKAHRIHLTGRPSPIRYREGEDAPEPFAVVPAPPEPVTPQIMVPIKRHRGKTECLWPIGDPGDDGFRFCGEAAEEGKPYCAEHCAKAYLVRTRAA